MKKYIFTALFLAILIATPALAQTSIADRIIELRAQIERLTQQLNQLLAEQNGTCHDFNRDIKAGDVDGEKGGEVAWLQTNLAKRENLFINTQEYAGEAGSYSFRDSTLAAVKKFQARYGIPQTGYVGPLTRAKLNELYGCKNKTFLTPAALEPVKVGEYYIQKIDAHEFATTSPLAWSLVDGRLPSGLTLNKQRIMCAMALPANVSNLVGPCPDIETSQAFIAGQTSEVGNFQFTVQAANDSQSARRSYNLMVKSTTTPVITVLSPNGGENWVASSTKIISWKYLEGPANAKVDLYLDYAGPITTCGTNATGPQSTCIGHNRPAIILDKNIAANATYNWIVATDVVNDPIPAGQYRVRICPAGSQDSCDSSDQPFTILAAQN